MESGERKEEESWAEVGELVDQARDIYIPDQAKELFKQFYDHHVCCEDTSPTKGLYDHYCQSDDRDLHSRSQVRLKLDYFF